jgi:hypothetical protein
LRTTFNAKKFNLSPKIAWIIVVQNLSRLEHDASLPVRTLSQQNSKIQHGEGRHHGSQHREEPRARRGSMVIDI